MRELIFIVDTLFGLIVGAFLLRLVLQLIRTDFRNPLVQAVVRITNPLVMPLRRILPPIGRVDTASVVAVIAAQMLKTTLVLLLSGAGLPSIVNLLLLAVVDLADATLLMFLVAIFVYVLLSWVAPDGYSPARAAARRPRGAVVAAVPAGPAVARRSRPVADRRDPAPVGAADGPDRAHRAAAAQLRMSDWHRWDGADLVLTLRVQPRASRDELLPDATRLRARITAPPVDGAANAHLLRYLAAEFGVPPSRAQLVRGTSGRDKSVRISAPRTLPAVLAEQLGLGRSG